MAPLADLRDIHLPPDPAWWPPAPGWWLLALALIGLLTAGAYWLVRVRRDRAPARAARRQLEEILAGHAGHGDATRTARALSTLLRRYAMARYDRATVAGLSGESWMEFLARHADGSRERFAPFVAEPYRRDGGDVESLAELARSVIDAPVRREGARPGHAGEAT